MLFERGEHARHGRLLLPHGHVDARNVLAPLVDDRVHGDGCLPGLAVADDQLPLPPADGDHRVDGLDTRLQGLADGLAGDDARGGRLQRPDLRPAYRTLVVEGFAERVDDPALQAPAHGHRGYPPGPLGPVALLDLFGIAEEDGSHVVLLEVEDHPGGAAAGKMEQLARHRVIEAPYPGDPVPGLDHGAIRGDIDARHEALEPLSQDGAHFLTIVHRRLPPFSRLLSWLS